MKRAPRPHSESEQRCLARLVDMDEALARMEEELPEDVRPLGAEARRKVAVWLDRLAAGGADLGELSGAMREISSMMDSLTARLLLVPWQRPDGDLPS